MIYLSKVKCNILVKDTIKRFISNNLILNGKP